MSKPSNQTDFLSMEDVMASVNLELDFVKKHGINKVLAEEEIEGSIYPELGESTETSIASVADYCLEAKKLILDAINNTNGSLVFSENEEASSYKEGISTINEVPDSMKEVLSTINGKLSDIETYNTQLDHLKKVATYKQAYNKVKKLHDDAQNNPTVNTSYENKTIQLPASLMDSEVYHEDTFTKNTIHFTYKGKSTQTVNGVTSTVYQYEITTKDYHPYIILDNYKYSCEVYNEEDLSNKTAKLNGILARFGQMDGIEW